MINLNLFPSWRLSTYMVRLFLTRSLAVLVALVLILMTLDLLGESGKILAVPGNGDSAVALCFCGAAIAPYHDRHVSVSGAVDPVRAGHRGVP